MLRDQGKPMDPDAVGYLAAAMLLFWPARLVWNSWRDFRRRYAGMRKRAERCARERESEREGEKGATSAEDRANAIRS